MLKVSQKTPVVWEDSSTHLLGRLKLLLKQEIMGSSAGDLTEEQILRYMASRYKKNPYSASMFYSLIRTKFYARESLENLCDEFSNIRINQSNLNENTKRHHFVEITNVDKFESSSIGVLFYRTFESDEECSFDYFILGDAAFPKYIAGFGGLEFKKDEAILSVFDGNGGWKRIIIDEIDMAGIRDLDYRVSLPLLAINYLHEVVKPTEFSRNDLSWIEDSSPLQKDNPDFVNLLSKAIKGEVPLVRMRVSLSQVTAADIEFCLSYPLEKVDEFVNELRDGWKPEIVVYWENGKFVMDDDYVIYLAYKILDPPEITVIHVGMPPKGRGKIIKVGGPELMPPLLIEKKIEADTQLSKELQLEKRLSMVKQTDEKSVWPVFAELSRLVHNTQLKEKTLHKFLVSNPVAIDAYGQVFKSEVPLGSKFRADIIIQYGGLEKQVLMIELERANLEIFTKRGDIRSEVNHASRQVEDWLMWWRENPDQIPQPFDKRLPAEGCVIIGRSINLNEEQKRRLLHLNSHRKIKILTYDNLLDKLEELLVKSF